MADVALRGLTKRFGTTTAVEGLELEIADGELVVLLGPTGAGKTTTLRLVAGLERPDEGEVVIGGASMNGEPPAARDVTFVFQQYSLYPHMTAFDNMAFPLRAPARHLAKADITARVHEIAELLHITSKLENKATRLSGGEMQRVAIGRALVRDPAVFLMDEPLSSLDAKLRSELRLELKRIQRELGATIAYVTHDQIEAMTMADRIGVMREGRLVQIGTPREIYETPRDVYVASRLGSPAMNLLPGDALPVPGMPAGTTTIGARTEHVRIVRADERHPHGRVEFIEHLGDQNHLHVRVGGHRLVVLVEPRSELRVGDDVSVDFEDPLFFDSQGARLGGGVTNGTAGRTDDQRSER